MRNVRIKFSKTGRMIYVSHLDVNRLMTRAVRRARLPMWYTEGFNPHPYIAFALPLSLGQSSESEYMDIRIEGEMSNEEVHSCLASALPNGINVIKVYEPECSLNEIGGARYSITLEFENDSDAQLFFKSSNKLLNSNELIAEKMGKKGHRKVLKQVNLIEQIFSKDLGACGNKILIKLTCAAGNSVNLNPALLIEALEKEIKIYSQQQYIVREELFTATGKTFQ